MLRMPGQLFQSKDDAGQNCLFSKVSSGAHDTAIRIGYARILADPGSDTPSGFAICSFRQAGFGAPAGTLQFSTQSGQPLGLSLR